VGYNETCSDTAHQAGLYCATLDGYLYCGFMAQLNTARTGFRATSFSELFDANNSVAVTNMRAALDSNRPVLLSSEVPPTFDSPDANGFAGYTSAAESSRGGHVYEITGYVTNTELAERLPNAPTGAGGGYFIAKNSWGLCFGDRGYIYLPFSWVTKNGWSAEVLNDVVEN
jgi:C1A family cysteine protease